MSPSVAAGAWTIVLAPAIAGGLTLAGGRPLDRLAPWLAGLGSLSALGAAAWLLASGQLPATTALAWVPGLDLSLALRLDTATVAIAILISFVGTLVLQYAGAYFGPTAKGGRAIATLALFEAAMLGLVLADDVLLLFVFWELTGICSFFLIRTDCATRPDAFPAARRALLVTAGGALPMLIGLIHLAQVGGSSRLSVLATVNLPPAAETSVFLLVLLGVVSKSAQVPLHFWLPGAMAAPTPISAYLHSATMVKAGIILLLYLHPLLGGSRVWISFLVPTGAITCIWGAYKALGQDDIKLLMAWSTVSQLGLLTLTAGLGTDLAIRAAVLHLFAHGIFKAGLFLSIGAIDHATHTRSLADLGGLRRRTPLLFACVAVLAGSMMGLPPFAGFLSKELILTKAMLSHPWVHACAIIGIAVGSVGTVAYTARFLFGVFTGEPRSAAARTATAPSLAFTAAPALLALVTLGAGLLAPLTDRAFLEPVSAALIGKQLAAPGLALWHGITPELAWTAVILLGGRFLYLRLGIRPLRDRFPGDASATFERFFSGAAQLGGRVADALAGARPSLYFGTTIVLGFAAALPLAGALADIDVEPAWRAFAVLTLQIASLGMLLTVRGRLIRILLLGVVGATVALFFHGLNAPDLMLTQLLVEVLMTVFFALALRLLSPVPPPRPRRRPARFLQVVTAVIAGVGAAAIVATLLALPAHDRLLSYYLEAGPNIAKGRNLVNVILADFRGLDTLIETIVVVLAALGVGGLLSRRELPADEGEGTP